MVGVEVLDQLINHCVTWFEGLEREAATKEKRDSKDIELNTGEAYDWARRVLSKIDLSGATAQTIEDFTITLPRMFKERIKFGEGQNIPEKYYPYVGFYISALCAKIELKKYKLPTYDLKNELNFAIDYLFYKFEPKTEIPEVIIDGPIGDNCFREAQVVAYVRGPAGYRNARGFAKGLVKFMDTTGNNIAEFIQGGHIQLKVGGKNIGLGGRGGTIEAHTTGDNTGKLNDGASIFIYHSAGANLGESMKMGYIQVGTPDDDAKLIHENRNIAKLEQSENPDDRAKAAELRAGFRFDLGPDAGKDMKGGKIKLFKRYNGALPPPNKTGGIFETYDGEGF